MAGTGRSDYPDQINNVLGFSRDLQRIIGQPSFLCNGFYEKKLQLETIAAEVVVSDDQLSTEYILPDTLGGSCKAVADAQL